MINTNQNYNFNLIINDYFNRSNLELIVQNDNLLNFHIYNQDWFLILNNGSVSRIYGINPNFDFLNYYSYIPVLHNSSFLIESNGNIILNNPPIFVPEISNIYLVLLLIFILFRKR